MIKKFCTSCGYSAPIDCIFCEECGVSFDESPTHYEPVHSPPKLNPFASLYDFVKQHLTVINGIVLFSGTVVGVLDFCVPVLKPILIPLYWITGILSAIMLLAALFPLSWLILITKLGYSPKEGKQAPTPLHQRASWRGAIVLLLGVTAAGVVSLAKANQGGALASSFPNIKVLQESILSLNHKTDQIQVGVNDANSKLDQIVKSVDPENSGDRCHDFECALREGASLKTLNKLWKGGSRFPAIDVAMGQLIQGVVFSNRKNRLEVLDFIYGHSINPEFKFIPYLESSSYLPMKRIAMVEQFWNSAKLSAFSITHEKKPLDKWNAMAFCISKAEGGINLIQFAALIDDEELLNHLITMGSKTLLKNVSCRSEELGKPLVQKGQVKYMPIVTYTSIQFSSLGEAHVLTRQENRSLMSSEEFFRLKDQVPQKSE